MKGHQRGVLSVCVCVCDMPGGALRVCNICTRGMHIYIYVSEGCVMCQGCAEGV